MRFITTLALAATLAACNAPTQTATTSTASTTTASTTSADVSDLSGYLIGKGDGWRLDSDPEHQIVVSLASRGDANIGVPYLVPTANTGGATLHSGEVTLTLHAETCTYHTQIFPYRATLQVGAEAPLQGCLTPRWDRDLVALMPQIDACLALAPPEQQVTYASRQPDGRVLVRLSSENGAQDCWVPPTGAATIHAMDDHLSFGSDGEAIFIRAHSETEANPGGDCYDAPEVRGADHELLGWMIDPQGC